MPSPPNIPFYEHTTPVINPEYALDNCETEEIYFKQAIARARLEAAQRHLSKTERIGRMVGGRGRQRLVVNAKRVLDEAEDAYTRAEEKAQWADTIVDNQARLQRDPLYTHVPSLVESHTWEEWERIDNERATLTTLVNEVEQMN